jgi:hypothetical protein
MSIAAARNAIAERVGADRWAYSNMPKQANEANARHGLWISKAGFSGGQHLSYSRSRHISFLSPSRPLALQQ